MKKEALTEKEARALLKKHADSNEHYQIILQHSQAVQQAALAIATAIKKRGHKVDLDFIKTASLLHDIGYFKVEYGSPETIKHIVEGGKILRKEGLPQHARVAESHIGAGLTKAEISKQKLPLPKKDFLAKTIEEKIIAYADNLIFRDRLATISEVVEKFKSKNLPRSAQQRLIKMHNEIEKLRGGLQTL